MDVETARHRTRADIVDLRRGGTEPERAAGDAGPWLRANRALHERMAAITPNQLPGTTYVGMLRHIADASVRAVPGHSTRAEPYFEKRVTIHAELVGAIASGDEARTTAAAATHNAMT
ncbi:FCD domain-containing protein [Streptomyces sp. NPDC091215]|uniref:FCD domain-containing protein n=1 Tax=Streptomyces sp. NPDC091215 TaxID=3155192 RepID=UPI00342ACB6B